MNNVVSLVCPECKINLEIQSINLYCNNCKESYPIINGIPSFVDIDRNQDNISSFEQWQGKVTRDLAESAIDAKLFERISKINIIKNLLYSIFFFEGRRERFYRKVFKHLPKGIVLDLGCGRGNELYKSLGSVVGLDISMHGLLTGKVQELYPQVIHGSATKLPFRDEQFDYILSADLIGHITTDIKDVVWKEIYRVLKKGGKTIHIIETDSNNICYRFGHKYPVLFQKYFVEPFTHFGLELPTRAIARIESSGLKLVYIEKVWGPIWETRDYITIFDNEYKTKSKLLSIWVTICKLLNINPFLGRLSNIPMGILSYLTEPLFSLDHGQGLLVVYEK